MREKHVSINTQKNPPLCEQKAGVNNNQKDSYSGFQGSTLSGGLRDVSQAIADEDNEGAVAHPDKEAVEEATLKEAPDLEDLNDPI